MGDEDATCATRGSEGFDDGRVAAADGVHRVDVRVGLQGGEDETAHCFVETVGVVDLDQGAVGISGAHCAAEPHLTFFLAAEEVSAEGDEDVARPVAEPVALEVCRGRACGPIVHPDVGESLAAGQVGHQGHDGDAGLDQPPAGGDDLREVGCLQDDAVGATRPDAISVATRVYRAGLAEVEPRPHCGWSQRGRLGLEGVAYG